MPLDELLTVSLAIIVFLVAACITLFALNIKWWLALLISFGIATILSVIFFIVWTVLSSRKR
jgi:hypothetical protein